MAWAMYEDVQTSLPSGCKVGPATGETSMDMFALTRRPAVNATALVAFVGVIATAAIAWQIHQEIQTNRLQASANVRAVAELRVRQVENWVARKMRFAHFLDDSSLLAELFVRWQDNGDAAAGARLLSRTIEYRHADDDDDALILDANANLLAREHARGSVVGAALKAAVRNAVELRTSTHTEIYPSAAGSGATSMDIVVPLLLSGATVRGVLVMRVDVRRALLPMLAAWPVPSRSGRSSLWQRIDGRLVDVMGASSGGFEPLLTSSTSLDGDPVRTQDGLGVHMLATLLPVEGGNWWLSSTLDLDEVDAPVEAAIGPKLAALAFGMLGFALAIKLFRQRQTLARVQVDRAEEQATLAELSEGRRADHAALESAARCQAMASALEHRHLSDEKLLAARTQELLATVDQLRDSVRFNRIIGESYPAGVAYWDARLLCRHANSSFAADFGAAPDDLEGRHAAEIHGGDYLDDIKPRLEAALAGEAQTFERVVADRRGIRVLAVTYAPERAVTGTLGIFETSRQIVASPVAGDVTEQTMRPPSFRERLASIDGLDLTVAVRSAANSDAALERILRSFVSVYTRGIPDLLTDPGPANSLHWRLACHSLKGAAGAIGAALICQEIQSIERALDSPHDQPGLASLGKRVNGDVLVLVSNLAAELPINA